VKVGVVGLVWAQAANGVIGADGSLPWHLPEDLARFKALTLGSTVVMGRATWESLPASVRPLPGRHNVVLTRRPGWQAPGAEVCGSLAAALDRPGDVWVVGGASVYAEALPHADLVVVTELADAVEGDTFAPVLGSGWRVRDCDPADGWATSRTGLRYRVVSHVPAVGAIAPSGCRV
jgi:dihydrofolate reductase